MTRPGHRARYGEIVRVIGGSSRGRRLSARLPASVRPTSDRVREAIFDILGSMGGVDGLVVADLFCGSGALGIEALSRGASHVTFVDHDRSALHAVRANLASAGLDTPAGRGLQSGRIAPSGAETPSGGSVLVQAQLPGWLDRGQRVDLVLCDPPYRYQDWATLLSALRCELAVLESDAPVVLPAGWGVSRARRYGGTLVTVVHRSPAPDDARTARAARVAAPRAGATDLTELTDSTPVRSGATAAWVPTRS